MAGTAVDVVLAMLGRRCVAVLAASDHEAADLTVVVMAAVVMAAVVMAAVVVAAVGVDIADMC